MLLRDAMVDRFLFFSERNKIDDPRWNHQVLYKKDASKGERFPSSCVAWDYGIWIFLLLLFRFQMNQQEGGVLKTVVMGKYFFQIGMIG